MNTKRAVTRSIIRVLIATGLVLSIPLVANQFTGGEGWSLFDFAIMGGLIMGTGLLYELAARTAGSKKSAVVTVAIAAIGGAAAVLGEFDDAPGLVLIGILLIIGAMALGVRSARRGSGTAEGQTGAARSA